MVTAEREDHRITRNCSFFKMIDIPSSDDEQVDGADDNQVTVATEPNNENNSSGESDVNTSESDAIIPPSRSTRVTRQPVRYPMDVVT